MSTFFLCTSFFFLWSSFLNNCLPALHPFFVCVCVWPLPGLFCWKRQKGGSSLSPGPSAWLARRSIFIDLPGVGPLPSPALSHFRSRSSFEINVFFNIYFIHNLCAIDWIYRCLVSIFGRFDPHVTLVTFWINTSYCIWWFYCTGHLLFNCRFVVGQCAWRFM